MPLILAIEPDARQAAQLTQVIRGRLKADLVLSDTTECALAAIGDRVPDLVLVPALISPQDDAALAGALRVIATAARVQMLTIPVLADSAAPPKRGLLARLRRRTASQSPDGCDPAVFGDQIAAYLAEVAAETKDGTSHLAIPIDEPTSDVALVAADAAPDAPPTEVLDAPAATSIDVLTASAIDPPVVEATVDATAPPVDALEAAVLPACPDATVAPVALEMEASFEKPSPPIDEPSVSVIETPLLEMVAESIAQPVQEGVALLAASSETTRVAAAEEQLSASIAEPAAPIEEPNVWVIETSVPEVAVESIAQPIDEVEAASMPSPPIGIAARAADAENETTASIAEPLALIDQPTSSGIESIVAAEPVAEPAARIDEPSALVVETPAPDAFAESTSQLFEDVEALLAAFSETTFVPVAEDLTSSSVEEPIALIADAESVIEIPALEAVAESTAQPVEEVGMVFAPSDETTFLAAAEEQGSSSTEEAAAPIAEPAPPAIEAPVLELVAQSVEQAVEEVGEGLPPSSETTGVALAEEQLSLSIEEPIAAIAEPTPIAIETPHVALAAESVVEPIEAGVEDEGPTQSELDAQYLRDLAERRQLARPSPQPKTVELPQSEWSQLVEALRQDIERLRVERVASSESTPTSAPAARVYATTEFAAPRRRDRRPRWSQRSGREKRPVRPPKKPAPVQDPWGFFDPEQCGFAALLAKLDEITEMREEASR